LTVLRIDPHVKEMTSGNFTSLARGQSNSNEGSREAGDISAMGSKEGGYCIPNTIILLNGVQPQLIRESSGHIVCC
jgi:hypothetical protein